MIIWVVAEEGCEGDLHAMSSHEAAVKLAKDTHGVIMGSYRVAGEPAQVWVVGGADCGCWNNVCHACLTEEEATARCDEANKHDEEGLTYAVQHCVIEG